MSSESPDLDRTLHAWFMALSPAERLRAVQSHANLIVTARGLEQVLEDRERNDRLSRNTEDAD